LIANLTDGHDAIAAAAQLPAPGSDVVPGWSATGHEGFVQALEMASAMDPASLHPDAVQPTANG
jgi:hypothetical protein